MVADVMRTEGLNKHQLRTKASSRAMLEAASDLIVEGGLDALTLAAIGERSGYSRGLASARFGSKAGLVDALIEGIAYRWRERNVRPAEQSATGLAATAVFFEAIWTQVERDDKYLRVLYTLMFESIGPDPVIRERIADLQRHQLESFADLFRRGIADGTVQADIDPDEESLLASAALRGVAFQWMIDPDRVDAVAALKLVFGAVLDRIATPYGIECIDAHAAH